MAAEQAYRASAAPRPKGTNSPEWLTSAKELASLVQTIVTAVAVLIGGYWTYYVFNLSEEGVPHLDIASTASHWTLDDKTKYVFVDFHIKNTGKARLTLTCAQVYIQQIRPVPKVTEDVVSRRVGQTEEDPEPLPWEIQQQVIRNLSSEMKVIGPGESDQITAEFLVSSRVRTAMIYGYIQNTNKGCQKSAEGNLVGTGWASTMIYDLEGDTGRSK